MADSNWTEVGDSYPSCQRIYVREAIVGPGAGIALTPPVVLTDSRTVGTPTLGTLALEGKSTPLTGTTRLTLRALDAGSDASVIRWLRSDNALRWSLGTDVNGNGQNNLWLFDNAQGIYGLYFPSGAAGDTTGSIRWGIGGRIGYDTATNQMTRRVNNVVRETLDPGQYTLSSGGLVQLTSATSMGLTATTTFTVAAGGNVVVSGAALVSLTTPGDISITGNSSVTISAGAGPVDINGLGTVKLDSVAGVVVSNAAAHPVGFYGSAGVAKQVGVPVTAAGIHAALVALGLIDP